MTRVMIIGGGPAGYEAALVAAQLGASVTLVERDGPGGACVVADCVPSKTFIAATERGRPDGDAGLAGVHARVKALAQAQSRDVATRLAAAGVRLVAGHGRLAGPRTAAATYLVSITPDDGSPPDTVEADVVLLATGATPRLLPDAMPDGERVLTWRQVFDLAALPERLVVVGSGVTGAEFASAYLAMGVPTTLVSSRDRVLPSEDPDAAALLERVLAARGMELVKRARAEAVRRTGDGVVVHLADGRTVTGSHALMTIGSVPNTAGLGLEHVGVRLTDGGHVAVDRVSRTNAPNLYAAGDVTGVLMLASVAAMQGRIAMWHALGEAVTPLRLGTVAANVFTSPEIAAVGVGERDVAAGRVVARSVTLGLATNARAKMMGLDHGFVKVFCGPQSGRVLGGVVVAPRASELVLPLALAVQNGLTVEQVAQTFAVYPSLSGSVTEAARLLMHRPEA